MATPIREYFNRPLEIGDLVVAPYGAYHLEDYIILDLRPPPDRYTYPLNAAKMNSYTAEIYTVDVKYNKAGAREGFKLKKCHKGYYLKTVMKYPVETFIEFSLAADEYKRFVVETINRLKNGRAP